MRIADIPSRALLPLCALALACADERDPAAEGTSLTAPATSGMDSDPAGTDTNDDANDDDDPSDDDPSEDEGESSGADDSTGEPLACTFAPGCYTPEAPASDRGIGSHIPVGCDGGEFRLAHAITVSQYADPEAPRSVPLV